VRLRTNDHRPEPYELIDRELARGRVEVCLDEAYGTVCDDFWDHIDASVVCTQLGFSPFGAIGGGERYGDDERNSVVNFISCNGSETRLLDCPFNVSGADEREKCGPLQDAHVICQDKATTPPDTTCSDRDLRVVGGPTVREGRVEVCYNHAWGTVCNEVYGPTAAGILCRELDFRPSSASTSSGGEALYDETLAGSGPIFISRLQCPSDPALVVDPYTECLNEVVLGLSECSHSHDVGVRCEAYCPESTTDMLLGRYQWSEAEAETSQSRACQFNGTLTAGSCEVTRENVTRRCNEYGKWDPPDLSRCISEITATLCFLRNMDITTAESSLRGIEDILARATDPQDRSSTNLNTVNITFQTVAETDSIPVDGEALEIATRIVSELQGWGVDNTTRETLQDFSAELVHLYNSPSPSAVFLQNSTPETRTPLMTGSFISIQIRDNVPV
jgi:hypothetical protein